MLNSLRQSAGTWVVKAFLGVLVLSFAIWGIGDIFRARPDTAVATVGDSDITGEQLLNEFNVEMRRLQATFGTSISREQALSMGLAQRALDKLTQRALYDQEVHRLGLTMSDADIAEEIRKNDVFKDERGNFDRFLFESRLAQAGFTEADFIAATRNDSARAQLLAAATGNARSPKAMVDAIYRYQQEKRTFRILTIPHAKIANVAEPEDADLASYHEKNSDRFMAPEFRDLTFLSIRPTDLLDEVLVDEAEVRDLFESRQAEFVTPERRDVEQIIVQDEETAKKIVSQIRGGGDYYKVAKDAASLDKDAVKLGKVTRADLLDEIADPVFALALNATSDPVQSALGWHVFRVVGIEPGGSKTFEDVRASLERDLKLERAHDAIFNLANKVEDELAGGAKLEEIAENLRLTHGRISGVDAAGRNRSGQPVNGLPQAPDFLATAFATEPGGDSQLKESEDGSYFLVRIDRVIEPAVRPLTEVREDVKAAVMTERRSEAARALADQLAERARGGARLDDLIAEAGGEIRTSEQLTRSQAPGQANLSAELAEALFKLNNGGVTAGASLDGEAHAVVRLESIVAAKPAEQGEQVARLKDFLDQGVGADLVEQYRVALTREHKIEINDWVIGSLFDQLASKN
jgi:peptidyl-prolyl cis-trans isomerase D